MVYDNDTKSACHDLTAKGLAAYQELMAKEADKILVDAEHKYLALTVKLLNKLGISSSFFHDIYEHLLEEK